MRAEFTPPLENEEWRPVIGWEGWYEVSDYGRVRRTREAMGATVGWIIKPHLNGKSGYAKVFLQKHGQSKAAYVHQLVLTAFAGARPPGYVAHHISGIKLDCSAANLKWVTRSENTLHAWRSGLTHSFQAAKTHCPQGHPYDEANTIYGKRGRLCRTCKQASNRSRSH